MLNVYRILLSNGNGSYVRIVVAEGPQSAVESAVRDVTELRSSQGRSPLTAADVTAVERLYADVLVNSESI